jgi:superfamily II DNA or RNA helicase/HKD family nuclease/diadenosine tetraphosphate (Ap4A) HIT family hydrolase
VSPGHALIIPRRHIASWFEATPDEQHALTTLIDVVRQAIERDYRPDGYNVGMNVGAAAGQTVPHLHLHVMPRYTGDVLDPRGGVRFVIPHKANYLATPSHQGAPHNQAVVRGASDPLLPHLVSHLDHAKRVDIAVSFIMESGVRLIEEHLRDVIARGGTVRVLTGRYLGVTEPQALRRLMDLGDRLELRVYESGRTSFHLKCYMVHAADGTGTAFVGSSNLSRSALGDGIEFNYRVLTSRDSQGFRDVVQAFDALYHDPAAIVPDAAWIARYEVQRQPAAVQLSGVTPEVPEKPKEPHEIQRAALFALAQSRANGNTAGLVVLATGLGKTWLSAFDTRAAHATRVLFVAHREEILDQAMRTYRTLRPGSVLGKYTGTERSEEADILFASIQTLGRQRHLDRFPADRFDYIVVDEFHHASASTYRRLLDHFTPQFLLGLTATPDRTDGADLLALCGGNLVYRCDLAEGIAKGLLAPFDYYGVPDDVDYDNIPWRSNRFDEEALTAAVATHARAQNALEQLEQRGGTRTLAFCVSQRHADFMKTFFNGNGKRAAAVHSGSTSDARAHSLERLQAGDLDVVCAVDMFNEGVDLPDVDTVMMLRPTESAILWLQQFGRGLRYQLGKRLKVIDYIGNHRSFLTKPRTLFAIAGGDAELAYALRLVTEGQGEGILPPGCSVTYDLVAQDILRTLLEQRGRGGNTLELYYRRFREERGYRPSASQAFVDGYDPKASQKLYQSWFEFVGAMGDLMAIDEAAEAQLREFLRALEKTKMTKSYKMLVLLAFLAEDGLAQPVPIDRLVSRVQQVVRRSPALRNELGALLDDVAELQESMEKNPIAAWTGGDGNDGRHFFRYAEGLLSFQVAVPEEHREAATALIHELAEWRLAVYLRRIGSVDAAPRIVCKVSHAGGRPILFLPSRDRTHGIPEGWVAVTANDQAYQANFVKVAVNVMQAAGSEDNVLPEVLRGWFGEGAGRPGTTHQVVFSKEGKGYQLAPWRVEQEQQPRLWRPYKRADIPGFFGFAFKGRESQQGVVTRPGSTLLFVTLDKKKKEQKFQYEDEFLSPQEFRWQSQNKTKRESNAGLIYKEHFSRGQHIHLFVRQQEKIRNKTQPFHYLGELDFVRWDGDMPITVWWRLRNPVPRELHQLLRVPSQ